MDYIPNYLTLLDKTRTPCVDKNSSFVFDLCGRMATTLGIFMSGFPASYWTDYKFTRLSMHAKMALVYFWTCPHGNDLGCYRLPGGYLAEDLNVTPAVAYEIIAELMRAKLIDYSLDDKWVLIPEKAAQQLLSDPARTFSHMPPVFQQAIKELTFPLAEQKPASREEPVVAAPTAPASLVTTISLGELSPTTLPVAVNIPEVATTPVSGPVPPPDTEGKKRNHAKKRTEDEEAFTQAWNAMARRCGLQTIMIFTASRSKSFSARMQDQFFAGNYTLAIDRIGEIPGLQGKDGKSTWKANVEWFLRPDTVIEIMEGKYDGWAKGKPSEREQFQDDAAEAIKIINARNEAKALENTPVIVPVLEDKKPAGLGEGLAGVVNPAEEYLPPSAFTDPINLLDEDMVEEEEDGDNPRMRPDYAYSGGYTEEDLPY